MNNKRFYSLLFADRLIIFIALVAAAFASTDSSVCDWSMEKLERDLIKWNDRIETSDSLNPRAYVQRGMIRFKLSMIDSSIQDFDRAEQLDPDITPFLWQRGLSYYYAGQYEDGIKQFRLDLSVNSRDVEETAWLFLCTAQQLGFDVAVASAIDVIPGDKRRVLHEVYSLYRGRSSVEDVLRAGEEEGEFGLFYAHLYLGLWYEVQNDHKNAKKFINMSVESNYRDDNYMRDLARVHKLLRNY